MDDGKAFVLQPFQRTMLSDYFAGSTETLILIAKKQGKTTLLAALALYHLITTPDAECVVAAASRDQATILFDQAHGFVRRSEDLQKRVVVKKGFREIRSLRDAGRIRVLASDVDTADGVIPTLALVDEQHRHKSADLYGVFRDGLGPRKGRMITISTAGDDELSPLGKMRSAALALPGLKREGAYTYARSVNGQYVMHEWAIEPSEDRDDMEVVKRANPAPWQTIEALKRRHDSPSMTPWQWARFACGIWEMGEESVINPLEWSRCGRAGLEIPDGEKVWLGVDLGWQWDTTAIVPIWVGDEERWVGKPAIVTPPRDGTSTREEEILDPILEFSDRFHVEAVVLDPNAGGHQLAQHLEDRGLVVIGHSQDPSPMALAAERLMTAIREGTLVHPDDPELTAHVLAAEAKTVSGEKWRFVKPRRRKKPIDALVALAMAHSVATDAPSLIPFEFV